MNFFGIQALDAEQVFGAQGRLRHALSRIQVSSTPSVS